MDKITIYLGGISLLSILITIYDKFASKHLQAHRTREKTLFILAFLGGALGMYLTMKLIRHKTQHRSFMIILPIFIILHLAAGIYFLQIGHSLLPN